nr:immunoglobulin light chain junction region [Macaca mulatta]MOX34457.1 immunoglobulin light chain junction region [Macaca mulatta]
DYFCLSYDSSLNAYVF